MVSALLSFLLLSLKLPCRSRHLGQHSDLSFAEFFARLAHYVVYSAAIPVARTLTFTAGWLAQIVIIASILRWI